MQFYSLNAINQIRSIQRDGPTEAVWVEFQAVDAAFLDQYPDLRFVACNATGIDHIDVEECEKRGVEVLSLQGWSGLKDVWSTAEHTILLILQAIKATSRVGQEPGACLRGSKVKIVGLGRVGQQVEALLSAFGAEAWHDIQDAQIITLHVPLNNQNYHLVDTAFLRNMRRGAVLCNTSRGDVINEHAVRSALINGHLAAYCTDFVPQCPILRKLAIFTDHTGGWTFEGMTATQDYIASELVKRLESR